MVQKLSCVNFFETDSRLGSHVDKMFKEGESCGDKRGDFPDLSREKRKRSPFSAHLRLSKLLFPFLSSKTGGYDIISGG